MMARTICCKLNVLLKVVLVVTVLSQHSLPGTSVGEALAAPPQPPPPPPQTDNTDDSDLDTEEVNIISLVVPQYARKGEEAELECQWSPSKNIYSLKWYFNDAEFFSYKPEADPTVVTLAADGFKVNVSMTSTTGEKLTLTGLKMSATGSYKCEVTMEGPVFVTADKSSEMTIVDVPDEKPRITGTEHQYRIGDVADLTCSSAPSTPVADLTWYINNEKAPTEYLNPMKSTRHPGGLQEAHKGLRFTVSRKHFRGGEMTLRCTASIPPLYTKTQQHSVDDLLTYNIPVLSSLEKSAVPGRAGDGGRRLVGVAIMVGALIVVEVVWSTLLSTTLSTTPLNHSR